MHAICIAELILAVINLIIATGSWNAHICHHMTKKIALIVQLVFIHANATKEIIRRVRAPDSFAIRKWVS